MKATIQYEFTDAMKAHAFHAEAKQYGPARMQYVACYPETWNVWVSPKFDAIVETR